MKPKKVAIIGAGPSGLVTAKTLLHNFPPGTFSPVIVDARDEVGGLWPVCEGSGSGCEGTLDPSMPTNLSRFTVGFSDLSWESVLGPSVPVFPQAGQVGLYLDAYRKRYIPDNVMRLGHRVLKTVRTARSEWEVSWKKRRGPGSDEIQVERFDLLVVASGYFARPCIPRIPGLELKELKDRVFHSSELRKINGRLRDEKSLLAGGNVAVIGGSMSGVEAASAVALHQSSHNEDESLDRRQKVYHVHSRPFWTLPTYLPHEISKDKVSFLPLDLAMYDLSRRPPGPIDYQLGLIPEEKVAKTNSYFGSMLGDEYAEFGYAHGSGTNGITSQPPWVAIGNDYVEFVRSGAIEATMGRVNSVQSEKSTGLACIKIDCDDGQSQTLDNISAVVMATGYTPFEALSFLSEDILSTLEYSTDDPFLPLVLDKGGTIRSEVPDLGFVGFYRGPYWGAMEMQARFLGTEWAKVDPEFSADDQRTSVRILRQPDSMSRRSQFPMGDYVGLMESFARDLGIDRTALSNTDSRSGPVVPARYVFGQEGSSESAIDEAQSTVSALMQTFEDQRGQDMAISMAIFRALHGKWKFTRTNKVGDQESGIVEFSPRYPSNGAGREYICHEYLETGSAGISLHPSNRSIFRLFDADGTAKIQILPGSLEIQQSHQSSTGAPHMLEVTGLTCKTLDGANQPGEYVAHARARPLNGTLSSNRRRIVEDSNSEGQGRYVFYFKGVSVVTWESFSSGDSVLGANEGPGTVDRPYTRTLYERRMA